MTKEPPNQCPDCGSDMELKVKRNILEYVCEYCKKNPPKHFFAGDDTYLPIEDEIANKKFIEDRK